MLATCWQSPATIHIAESFMHKAMWWGKQCFVIKNMVIWIRKTKWSCFSSGPLYNKSSVQILVWLTNCSSALNFFPVTSGLHDQVNRALNILHISLTGLKNAVASKSNCKIYYSLSLYIYIYILLVQYNMIMWIQYYINYFFIHEFHQSWEWGKFL